MTRKIAPNASKILLSTTAMAGLFMLMSGSAYAVMPAVGTNEVPTNPVVAGGTVGFTGSTGLLNVNQSTDRAVINWGTFNIGTSATTNFSQPTASALVVNRVTGGDPAQILGTLNANGRVMILDQNGVFFGPGSVINVGAIVASTGDVADSDIMNGNTKFDITNFGSGSVENQGTITVAEAGIAAFVSPVISNSGIINAKMGKVGFGAGSRVTLDLNGDHLLEIAVTDKIANALITHSGTINAEGGSVLMTAQAAQAVVDNVINMNGVINASSATQTGGKIVLSGGEQGNVNVTNTMGTTGVGGGGDITVSGQNVNITNAVTSGGNIAINNTGIFSATAGSLHAAGSGTIDINQNPGGSIQNAVSAFDNSGSGQDTLHLGAGIFVDNAQVVIDKNLNVTGAGQNSTIITPGFNTSGSFPIVDGSGWWLLNASSNVNISNLTFDGAGHDITTGVLTYGSGSVNNVAFKNISYHLAFGDFDGRGVTNYYGGVFDILNSSFSNMGYAGAYYRGAGTSGSTISGNVFTGKPPVNGVPFNGLDYSIELEDGAGSGPLGPINITNNTISGDTATTSGWISAGINLSTNFNAPGVVTAANISNNVITGNYDGVSVGFDNTDTSVVIAHNNDLSGNTYGVALSSTLATADFSNNYWGNLTEVGVLAYNQAPFAFPASIDFSPFQLNHGTPNGTGYTPDTSNLFVTALGVQQSGLIQEGANSVTSGGTVTVGAGTFVDGAQVVIGHDLNVVGQGQGVTTVTPGFDTTNSGDSRGWWLLNAGTNVSISDLTFDGAGHMISIGLLTRGSGSVDHVDFKNISYGPSNAYLGRAFDDYGGGIFNITNSTFSNIGRIGAFYYGASTSGSTISDSTFTGKGSGDKLDYSIELEAGAQNINILRNTISGDTGVASDGSISAGILLSTYYNAPGVITSANISNNVITGNTDGIVVGYDGTDTSVVIAHNNDLSGNTYGAGLSSTLATADFSNNYWGNLTEAGVLAYMDPSGVPASIDFSPFQLNHGTPNGTGYTPDTSNLFVTALGVQQSGLIQEGADSVTSGGTVTVGAGTFNENVNVTRAMTLNGPGQAAIVNNGLTVNASGVTIDSILPSAAVGTGPSNYTITYLAGELTVNPLPVVIDQSIIFHSISTFIPPSGGLRLASVGGGQSGGVSAQDLENIAPGAGGPDNSGEKKTSSCWQEAAASAGTNFGASMEATLSDVGSCD